MSAASPPRPGARGVDPLSVAMGLAFALIWSSAFTSAKIALADAPPFLLLTARFAASGLIAVALAVALGQRIPRDRRAWALILVFGLCRNALYPGLNFLAMTKVPAGLAAIVASALPLAVEALSRVAFAGVAAISAGIAAVRIAKRA